MPVLRRSSCNPQRRRLAESPSAAGVDSPEFLEVHERIGTRWEGDLTGAARGLVRWAADHGVDDLTIGPPDLETLFRRYYA